MAGRKLRPVRMIDKKAILDFISRRLRGDVWFLNGNCYWAAVILKQRFPEDLDIYYVSDIGHFVAGNDRAGLYFDASGEYDASVGAEPITLYWIREFERDWYERLMRDCRD